MKHRWSILFLRHGETPANKEKRYLGRTDEHLSEDGRQKLIEQRHHYPKADFVYASPMLRCLETSRILYTHQKIHVIDEFKEMNFGEFEGKNYIDLKGDARYQAWIDSNGTIAFPQGESREEFIRRCQSGFEKMVVQMKKDFILQEEKKSTHSAVCIVHGGTIMALLSSYYGGDYYDYQCKNGEGYLCDVTEDGVIQQIYPFTMQK